MINKNVCIFNYWWNRNNYGAVITAYALQELVKQMNYVPYIVNNIENLHIKMNAKYSFIDKFNNKYLHLTNLCSNFKAIMNLEKDSSIFITGPDQVFRAGTIGERLYQYFLDFLTSKSKKISFAASFGVDKQTFLKETDSKTIRRVKQSLKTFDYLSVREKSGIELCKDLFDIDAKWIIDPVFILDKSYYDKLISKSTINTSDKIVSYVLDTNSKFKKAYKYLSKKYGMQVTEIADSNIEMEDWLASIKNCKLLVTDSFHGLCFAIIFNKPFICISNKTRGITRFESIIEMLNIKYNILSSIDDIYAKECVFNNNWNDINQNIEKEKEKALDFLKKSLEGSLIKTNEKDVLRTNFLENKIIDLETQNNFKIQLRKSLWNSWLVCFHNYFPYSLKKIIRYLRDYQRKK